MTHRRLLAVLAATTFAVLAACGSGDDEDAGGDTGGESTTEATTASGGSTDLGDFAVALPAWAEAVTPDISGSGLDVVLFNVPLEQRDATIAFYQDWTDSQSETYIRSDSDSGGVSFQSDVAAGEEKTIISILSPLDGDDFVSVSLSRGTLE